MVPGFPIGLNYGGWYGVITSLNNVKKFCKSVDVNQRFPMSVNTYAKVQSCKIVYKIFYNLDKLKGTKLIE